MDSDEFPVRGYLNRYRREPTGGLLLIDKDLISKQRHILKHLIKSLAEHIRQRKSIVNISLPVNIFEPISLLHRVCAMLGYAPVFLERAASECAMERLKLVIAFAIAMLHLCTEQLKPFNPILGETLQGRLGSAEVYAEQTSHHPPVSNFLVLGTAFRIIGFHEFWARASPNSLKARQRGLLRIDFSHDSVYVSLPYATMKGLIFGKRIFNWTGVMTVCDPQSRLFAQIAFNPQKKGFFHRMFSRQTEPCDSMMGSLYRVTENHPILTEEGLTSVLDDCDSPLEPEDVEETVCDITGFWPLYVDIGERRYWSFEQFRPALLTENGPILPSDSRVREDLVAWGKGDEDLAQREKERLEELQRLDVKLRNAHAKA